MKLYLVGTVLCITAAAIAVAVGLMDLPKVWIIAAIPVLFTGFGVQMLALWQNRPSVALVASVAQAQSKKRGVRKFDEPRVIGLILALLGSIGAVAVGIYITHDAN